MDIILGPLITVLVIALDLFKWAVIISAILSWLVAFNVINTQNQFVSMVGEFLWRLTEPALRPIRSIIPSIGGMDLSPIVLLLIIIFLQNVLINLRISFA
ncbi:membrane protein [Kiloniella spongiae]|uniref:Membrane protein n=1 Tax=Kiloniella spongiae TaxID=1489064 RepID=A0A0H2MDT0_9PROT|nr:YggT family protein [Kiloniella spongiae]KLN60689.1 membrane protein [Kiloniella spongiae]